MRGNGTYFLQGEGEMRKLLRDKDWTGTKIGNPKDWPSELKNTLDILLNSLFPMFLFWGEEHLCFYNDAYRPSLGVNGKHPLILGKNATESWPEIWPDIGPMIGQIMNGGSPIWRENQLLPFYRNGQLEDIYWTFCYSPVRDISGEPVAVLTVCTETTETIRAKGMLLESEQRFRTMAEATSLLISVGDIAGNTIYYNAAWSEFTGSDMDCYKQRGWAELVHPDDKEKMYSYFDITLKSYKKWEAECRLRNKDGDYKWMSVYVSPRFRPDGTFDGFVSSLVDTHQRKTIEQEALKFQFMADNASDPLILMRKDASFEYLNKKALEMWEYDHQEAKLLKVPDIDAIYNTRKFNDLFKSVQEGSVPIFQTVHRSKSGLEFPVEVKVSGFTFKGEPHMLAIARDITERRLAEKSLRESEQRFRELADHAPMWIWITDSEVNVEYANRNLLDFIGIKNIADFTGQVWVDIVHPTDVNSVFETFGNAAEKRIGFSTDYRVRRADTGIYEWFTVKGVPRFKGKDFCGFIGTGMNVHRQKTFSEQLRKEVDLRTKELATANDELTKSNMELQSFAYISSHDLQEPLRKIQTFCSILLSEEYERLSTKGKGRFQRMSDAAKRMRILIDDLLAYSKLNVEDREYEMCELSELLHEVETNLIDNLGEVEGKIELMNSIEIPVVSFQFKQLLSNLISNSLKYAREHTATHILIDSKFIEKSEANDTLILQAYRYAYIRISDNGIGFEESYAEKIFEVFQRLHGKEKYSGTGVGLAIVKKIVENHKGLIKAHGTPGVGAVFEIYIPCL